MEGAQSSVLIKNFDNNRGILGKPQNTDDIKTSNFFYFISQRIRYKKRITADLSMGYSSIEYNWQTLFPTMESGKIKFNNQILPNFGLNYVFEKGFSIRGKIGKGNSTPTTEEVRSSNQQINTDLSPEYGWNKEIGIRKQFGTFLFAELSYFNFHLKDAIVRRLNDKGQEYFVNAGGTRQKGLEFLIETRYLNFNNPILDRMKFWISGNVYHFRFEDYKKNKDDFSGNPLTGVPSTSLQALVSTRIFKKLDWDISHFYTSKTPLNDANSVQFAPYWIGNMNFSYPFKTQSIQWKIQLQLQNLYNTSYVSGFDINAFGNRYYNPAAKRNFSLGIQADF